MASQYLSAAGSLPKWDCDVRPRTRSSMSSDISYLEEQQPGGGGCSFAAGTATGPPRRRIGRPIAYTGDPEAQHLTDAERRRIKRRIANRESARRVRRKRQNALEDMQERLEQVHEHVSTLTARLQQAERERAHLVRQLCEVQHGRAGETAADTAAGVTQQEAEEAEPASLPAVAAAGLPPRSHVSYAGAMNGGGGGGGGAVTTGGLGMDGFGPSVGPVPRVGAMFWSGGGAATDLPRPRQPMFVAVTPATSHTLVRCSTGKPALAPTSPQAQPPPPLAAIPLLDLQSMPSADDPLDCFLGGKPTHIKEEAATNQLGVEWRF